MRAVHTARRPKYLSTALQHVSCSSCKRVLIQLCAQDKLLPLFDHMPEEQLIATFPVQSLACGSDHRLCRATSR